MPLAPVPFSDKTNSASVKDAPLRAGQVVTFRVAEVQSNGTTRLVAGSTHVEAKLPQLLQPGSTVKLEVASTSDGLVFRLPHNPQSANGGGAQRQGIPYTPPSLAAASGAPASGIGPSPSQPNGGAVQIELSAAARALAAQTVAAGSSSAALASRSAPLAPNQVGAQPISNSPPVPNAAASGSGPGSGTVTPAAPLNNLRAPVTSPPGTNGAAALSAATSAKGAAYSASAGGGTQSVAISGQTSALQTAALPSAGSNPPAGTVGYTATAGTGGASLASQTASPAGAQFLSTNQASVAALQTIGSAQNTTFPVARAAGAPVSPQPQPQPQPQPTASTPSTATVGAPALSNAATGSIGVAGPAAGFAAKSPLPGPVAMQTASGAASANPVSASAGSGAVLQASATPASALAGAIHEAVATQSGLGGLFAIAQSALQADVDGTPLPPSIIAAAKQILGLRMVPDGLTGQTLANALKLSGAFTEGNLVRPSSASPALTPLEGPVMGGAATATAGAAAAVVDTKMAVLLLKNLLNTWIGPQDQANRDGRSGLEPRLPPPRKGGGTMAQVAARSLLPKGAGAELIGRLLQDEAERTLSRIRLSQVASLPDTDEVGGSRALAGGQTWTTEVPFAFGRDTRIIQFEIEREASRENAGADQRTTTIRFSVDLDEAGPVHARIGYLGGRVNVRVWAEFEATAKRFSRYQFELTDALSGLGLNVEDVRVRTGVPPSAATEADYTTLDLQA